MSALARTRLGIRLARRELRRAPVRTLLVVVLVLAPAAAMAGVVVLTATAHWTPEEWRAARWGQVELTASAPISPQGDREALTDAHLAELASLLPAGSELVEVRFHQDWALGARRPVVVSDLDVGAPSSEGRFDGIGGRAPRGIDEVAVTAALADHLDLGLGSTVAFRDLGRELEVVGIVEPRLGDGTSIGGYDVADAFVGAPLPEVAGPGAAAVVDSPAFEVLVDLPEGTFPAAAAKDVVMADADGLPVPDEPWVPAEGPRYPSDLPSLQPVAAAGFALEPVWSGSSDGAAGALGLTYLLGAVALVVLGTVITAAFAVGARRQLRSIGLLSSTGAPPAVLRWYLVAQGVVAGLVGSLLGIALAVSAAHLAPESLLRAVIGHAIDGVVAPPAWLVPVVVIATLVAAAAAGIPAWTAARVPVLAALAGRRPQAPVPRAVPVLGLLAVGAGCFLLFASVGLGRASSGAALSFLTAALGSLAVLGGCSAVAPVVVGGLEHRVGRAPVSVRLAGRSLARSRLRSSAVVAAVVAATSVLVAGSALVATAVGERQPFDDRGPLPDDVVLVSGIAGAGNDQVAAIVPDAEQVHLATLDASLAATWADRSGSWHLGGPVLATPEVLDAYEVPDDLRAVLRDGGWVSALPVGDEPMALELSQVGRAADPTMWADPQVSVEVPLAGSFESPLASWSVPVVLVGEGTAAELGLEEDLFQAATLFELAGPLDGDARTALEELAAFPVPDDRGLSYGVTLPPSGHQWTPTQVRALVLAGVFAAVLAVVATGLLLAGRDGRDEAAVLAAVGAPPRVLRRVGAARATLLVATAVALAVPAGLLAAWTLFQAVDADVDGWFATFRVDGTILAFTLVMAPLVGVLTWLAGGLRDLVRPARPEQLASWD